MSTRTTDLTALGLSEQALRSHGGNGLSNAGRLGAWLVAVLLILLGCAGLAAAGAMPTFGDRPGATDTARSRGDSTVSGAPATIKSSPADSDGKIHAAWDGPTTHLAWTDQEYATVESDFIGTRIASPGDQVQRTLRLRNDGAGNATMSIRLQLGKQIEDTTVNTQLDDAVDLFWNVSGVTGRQSYASLLRDGEPDVAEVSVPRGETAVVLVGFDMPADVTGHRNEGAPSTVLDFRVLATMQGETVATPPALAFTGANLATLLALAAIALGLSVLGILLAMLNRRRHRCADCDEPIRATKDWTLHHAADGRRIYRCAKCSLQPTLEVV